MNRLGIVFLLVFVLSGVPAAAVACDLVVCPGPTMPPRASTGCHDHALPQSGKGISARADDCSHIAVVDPYVTSALGIGFQPAASTVVASVSGVVVIAHHGLDARPAHGPPHASPALSSLALRI